MKDTRALLQDMLDAVTSIESFKIETYDSFVMDEKTQDAVMFNLIIMGEAAHKIADDFQTDHPEIPWSSIIGTRNVIVHGYDQVRLQIVWDIIHRDLQTLKRNLKKLV